MSHGLQTQSGGYYAVLAKSSKLESKRTAEQKHAKRQRQKLAKQVQLQQEEQKKQEKYGRQCLQEFSDFIRTEISKKAGEQKTAQPKKYIQGAGLPGGCRSSAHDDASVAFLPQSSTTTIGKCWQAVVNTVSDFGYLGIAVYYNVWRDFWWQYWTAENWNPELRHTDNWNQQNYGQWLAGTAGMFAGMLVHLIACKLAGHEMPWKKSLIAITSASLAIPGWNKAGQVGAAIAENYGLSTTAAGYVAGLFTGEAEGPIQEAATTLGKVLANDDDEREKFKKDPRQYLSDFAKRMGLAFAPIPLAGGASPGDVWQFVSWACIDNNVNIIVGSALVALAVGASNVIYAKLQDKIMAGKYCASPQDFVAATALAASPGAIMSSGTAAATASSPAHSDATTLASPLSAGGASVSISVTPAHQPVVAQLMGGR